MLLFFFFFKSRDYKMIVPRHMKLVLSMHASFIISPTRPKKEG